MLKKLIRTICAYVPTPLPVGMTAFNKWAEEVISLTNLPDNDSTRFALATTILHQQFDKSSVPKIKFARMMLKSAANQIASAVQHELKEKQMEAAKKEQEERAAKAAAEEANTLTVES